MSSLGLLAAALGIIGSVIAIIGVSMGLFIPEITPLLALSGFISGRLLYLEGKS